jgi:hypothetical protein
MRLANLTRTVRLASKSVPVTPSTHKNTLDFLSLSLRCSAFNGIFGPYYERVTKYTKSYT